MRRNYFSLLGSRLGRKPVYADPRAFIADRAMRDERVLSVVHFLDKAAESGWREFTAADGAFYRDSRSPFMIADQTAVAGTTEAIAYPTYFTAIPADYLYVGKMNYLSVQGKIVTAASTPGTMTWNLRYGTAGTSADVGVASGAATATLSTSQTKSMGAEAWTSCRTTGSSGSLIGLGRVWHDAAILAGTAGNLNWQVLPSGSASAATVDTTVAKGINLNIILGSASDNFTAQILTFEALN